PRMNRSHVLVYSLYDHAQPCELLCLSFALGGIPQALVAADATDFDLDLRVGNFRYVGVAFDTLALAMHALLELLLVHEQRAHLPVRPFNAKLVVAVTSEACFARYLFRGLRGRLAGGDARIGRLRHGKAGGAGKSRNAQREQRGKLVDTHDL